MKNNTIENITEYAKNATAIEEPSEYSTGVKVGWTAPAKWWNWLMNAFSRRLGETYETVKSIHEEIKNAVGGTLDETSNTQLKNTLDNLGRVSEVNDKLPDANGKVDVFAEDILGYVMVKEASGKYITGLSTRWNAPAVLPDGTLVAGAFYRNDNGIIYSTDKGVTWTASSQTSGYWNTPAVLPDGTLVAGSGSDDIFRGIFWIILLVPTPNLEQVKNSAASFMFVVAASTVLPKSTKELFVSQGQYAMTLDTNHIYQASVAGDNISSTLVTSL